MTPEEARQRGFDEAFAMGVASLREYWLFLLPYVGKVKSAVEELDVAHGVVFDTIEGRAEGAPTFKDAPPEIWDRMTGEWPGILDQSTAEATGPKAPTRTVATAEAVKPGQLGGPGQNTTETQACYAGPAEPWAISETIIFEIVAVSSEGGHSIVLISDGNVVDRSRLYRDQHVAMMLARRLEREARRGLQDKP